MINLQEYWGNNLGNRTFRVLTDKSRQLAWLDFFDFSKDSIEKTTYKGPKLPLIYLFPGSGSLIDPYHVDVDP